VKNAKIKILHKCRQLCDIDDVGQSRERRNASGLWNNGFLFGTYLIVQFLVAIVDCETQELWNCNMKKKNRKLNIVAVSFYLKLIRHFLYGGGVGGIWRRVTLFLV
jgi:hypothetical protein